MRQKVIDKLEELRRQGPIGNEFNSFEVDEVEDLSTLTDEQLIEVLENYGTFEG